MLEKTMDEFVSDAENLVRGAIVNDDFVKVKTKDGIAVLISEAEWNIMADAFKMLLSGQGSDQP